MEKIQLFAHLFISITPINMSDEREKGSGHGKILHMDCSAVAMPNDLFFSNNFALSVHSLFVYLITLNIMALDWQLFMFFHDQAISNF